ncbi:phosphatidate cytidylyltransferase [Bacillus sp. HMF5848]|uniref:phosphatidate cytidylyltransferase n=1 Tax=Bacillus sp. HMF5848 TaxID=2495421 RepID=UPI000F776EEB|nr:phosphatidate cytidylyltransferase [Bacillus sp. HMF5848]RSK27062.1 phosphatidate cytidylyltransferase [Bacillus sp. HMF5848]
MKQRVLTGVLAAAFFIPIVIIGNGVFTVLVYVLASIAMFELLRMKNIQIFSVPGVISVLLLWVLLLPAEYTIIITGNVVSKVEVALLSVLLFLTYTVVTKNRFSFDDVAFVTLATLYIGIGFYYLIVTREAGLHYILFALIIIWATDSGAYFFGRAFGKQKLWPEISPNKTIEGSIGGVISAIVAVFVYQLFIPMDENIIKLLIMTILLSIFGQVGDLVESALKRHYAVKDSGQILPGHGGILDRFDSLLFVLPILHFLQLF